MRKIDAMPRVMPCIAVLAAVLALVVTGCRDITTDLHDIYTITLYPGSNGAVDGQMDMTLQTDINGRASLPAPQRGKWIFECEGYEVYYTIDGIERHVNHKGGYAAGYCATNLGCTQSSWTFEPDGEPPAFIGWHTSGGTAISGSHVFRCDTPLFARWQGDDDFVLTGSVAAQIDALHSRPGLPSAVTINVPADEKIDPQMLSFNGRPITITIRGIRPVQTDYYGKEYTRESYTILTLNDTGALFTVGNNVNLVLENVQLHGFHKNDTSIVVIEKDAYMEMRDNVSLAYNTVDSITYGGAITVQTGGVLDMYGGMIFHNLNRNRLRGVNFDVGGGGVWVRGGKFNMYGGRMEENYALGGGGAVRVSHGGVFNVYANPNTTSDNNLDPVFYDNAAWRGGAIYVVGSYGETVLQSVFNMYAGSIEENYAPLWGGGVGISRGGRFNFHGGDIILNEASDGAGIDNEGILMIHDGWVVLNKSLSGSTGGISNWWIVEMWGGIVGYNEGGFGGGIRNFGEYTIFSGDIVGNIGNGGPAGGILNIGYFQMHGGNISHNISNTSQGGGIFHGLSSVPDWGKFIITNGVIWNNRDLTIYHKNGLPGSHGNIRRNTPTRSFFLARPGFFSLNESDRPAGWEMIRRDAPVFDNVDPDEIVRRDEKNNPVYHAPNDWREIFWFIPPMPTSPVPDLPDGTFMRTMVRSTPGRPRIETRTPKNPGTTPMLIMDESLENVNESTLAANPEAMDMYGNTPHGGTPRGGTYFPSKLGTVHTDDNAEIGGYAWVIRHGHMEAMTLEWFNVRLTNNDIVSLALVQHWPVPPSLGYVDFYQSLIRQRPIQTRHAWPWDPPQGQSPSIKRPNLRSFQIEDDPEPEPEPEMPLVSWETALLERAKRLRPELYDKVLHNLTKVIELPEWLVPTLEIQIEYRETLFMEQRNEKRFDDMVNKFLQQGDNGGGGGPTPL